MSLDVIDELEQFPFERIARFGLDDCRGLAEERGRDDVIEEFAANADVGLAPSGLRVGLVPMPFAGVKNDDGARLDANPLSALKFDDASPRSDVENLVFPIGKCASFVPGEIVVGRMVGVRIGLAGFGDFLSGACT